MNVLRYLTLMSIQVWVLADSIRPREQSLEMMDRIPQTGGLGRGPMMKPPRRGGSQLGSDEYDATIHTNSDRWSGLDGIWGTWGAMAVKVGMTVLVILIMISLLVCCIIAILRKWLLQLMFRQRVEAARLQLTLRGLV